MGAGGRHFFLEISAGFYFAEISGDRTFKTGVVIMETIQIGVSAFTSSRLAYGCWRVAGTWDPAEVTPESRAAGHRAIVAAYEAGYTLFDNADIYCRGAAETILGEVLKQTSGMRERVLIATKCGIR